MSSMIPKIAALGAACFGFTMFRDNMRHHNSEAAIHLNEMVEHDYMHHTLHSMHDYSGNNTMTGWKHWLLNPANFHVIKRPYLWAKNTVNTLWDNMVPLGLTFAGLTWGFGGKIIGSQASPGVLRYLHRGIQPIASFGWTALKEVASATRQICGPRLLSIWRSLPPIRLDARGTLGLAAVTALGMWGAHMFKRELTGENRDEATNYLSPPGH